MKANAVNLASFANALCHRNATPLSVAVLVPCAWGENLACGVAWQGVVNLATKRHSVAKWAVLTSEADKAKMGQFGRGTSLSLLALFGTPLR